MDNAGLSSYLRSGVDAHVAGDPIRRLEPYAADVQCQPVRVVLDHGDGLVTVGFVDFDGVGGAYPVPRYSGHITMNRWITKH